MLMLSYTVDKTRIPADNRKFRLPRKTESFRECVPAEDRFSCGSAIFQATGIISPKMIYRTAEIAAAIKT